MGTDVASLLDLGWKLLVVLGLAVVAMRALRWLSSPTLNGNTLLRVVSRLPIGPQQSVLIVAAGRKTLLIGQSPNALTVLAELDPEMTDAKSDSHPSDGSRQDWTGGVALTNAGFATAFDKALATLKAGLGRNVYL